MKTLCILIRYKLINEKLILQLSYVNKGLYIEYKKYIKNIPELTILYDDITEIFKHNKIITFHKYNNIISKYCDQDIDNITSCIYNI